MLVNWCGESLIEPLLRYIQEADQTEDFEEFLIDNFGEPELQLYSNTPAELTVTHLIGNGAEGCFPL